MRPISVASALVLAYLVWASRNWPLIHDAPLMHYVAWLIDQGGVPYRDVFDMNLPGAYLLHLAVLRLGGPGDVAWRLFDLAWLGATCGVLVGYCRRISDGWASTGAALLFALYHLSGGVWHAGQRDFLLCFFLLLGAWGVARGTEEAAPGALVWAGLALGAAMTIKPHAALFWLFCAAIAARDRSWAVSPSRAAGLVIGAGLVLPSAVFGWLAWRGGLGPFVEIFSNYVVPLYGHVGRVSPWLAIGWPVYGRRVIALFGLLVMLALLAPTSQEPARKGLALVGVLYGLIHFVVQGKGWEYQLNPLILFCCALAPASVVQWRHAGMARALDVFGARRQIALVAWALLVVVLGVKGVKTSEAGWGWIAEKASRVAAITRDLQKIIPPGATVQVMDTTSGGIHSLLRLHLRQPTRFMYDFYFFHDVGDPRIEALRAEFMSGLESGRPAAIVVLENSWPVPGYGRLDTFPRLRDYLERECGPPLEGSGYRIYAKRSDS